MASEHDPRAGDPGKAGPLCFACAGFTDGVRAHCPRCGACLERKANPPGPRTDGDPDAGRMKRAKRTEFNRLVKAIRTKDKLDPAKAAALSEEAKEFMTQILIGARVAIVIELLPEGRRRALAGGVYEERPDSLAGSGYHHITRSPTTGLVFVHKSENVIK